MNKWFVNAVIATSTLTNLNTGAAEIRSEQNNTETIVKNEAISQTMTLGGSKLRDRKMVSETKSLDGSKFIDRMNITSTMLMGGSKLRDFRMTVDQVDKMTTLKEKVILLNQFFKNGEDNTEVIEELRKTIDRLSN